MQLDEKIDKLLSQNETIVTSTSETSESIKILQIVVAAIIVAQSSEKVNFEKIDTEISALKTNIATLSDENNKLHQQSLSSEIVIFGLPFIQPMHELVVSLSAATALPITINDFAHIYPAQQRNTQNATIRAKFYSQQIREIFMQRLRDRKKAAKPLLIDEFMQMSSNDPRRGTEISIRSNLTKINQDILKEARNHKTKIKFVWENNGRILTRQTETSPVVEISSMRQLMELLNPSSTGNQQNKIPQMKNNWTGIVTSQACSGIYLKVFNRYQATSHILSKLNLISFFLENFI